MESFSIQNFKYGLDTRRSELTSQPGTLQKLENGHVTPGAEIEKRKSFQRDNTLFSANTFGLQDTEAGLVTFGSADVATVTLPQGVTYQQLRHPGAVSSMISVPASCNFRGKAFVVAAFDDGNNFLYYDGRVVTQSFAGLVFTDYNCITLALQLANLIQLYGDFGWNPLIPDWHANASYIATGPADAAGLHEQNFADALFASCLIMSPPGVHFTPMPSWSSMGGRIGVKLVDQNYGGIAAKSASAAFQLTGALPGTVDVKAPTNKDGTTVISLTNGPVVAVGTLAATALAIANKINANTFISGYTALVADTTVTVNAPADWGNVTFNLEVDLDPNSTITLGNNPVIGQGPLALTLTPAYLSVVVASSGGGKTVGGTVKASTTGAIGVTVFEWKQIGSADGIICSVPLNDPNSAYTSVGFSRFLAIGSESIGHFVCKVTDLGNQAVASVEFVVDLSCESNR